MAEEIGQAPRVPTWTLGDRLRKARELANLTQEQMADRLDVKHSTIGSWERGDNQPRNLLEVLQRWAAITDVDEGWLIGLNAGNPRVVEPEDAEQMELALGSFSAALSAA